MTDREALAAALEAALAIDGSIPVDLGDAEALIVAAARERLAQLPEKCGTCEGSRWVDGGHRGAPTSEVCPNCHGSGKVYPAELVERIAKALYEPLVSAFLPFDKQPELVKARLRERAVVVLDVLNGETP